MSPLVLTALWMLVSTLTPELEVSWHSPAALSTTPVEAIALEDGSIVMLSVARLSGGLDDAWLTRWDQPERLDSEMEVPAWSVRLDDPALWSTGRLASDQAGSIFLLAANFSRLIIEQRSSIDGARQWRDEQTLDPGNPHASYRPLLALGGESIPILAAVVSGPGVWLGRWTASGALLDSELLVDDEGSASPGAIAVDHLGRLAISTVVAETGGGSRFRTWFQSLDGSALGDDTESAPSGATFGPFIVPDDQGGWILQAGLESECGVFQTHSWRIDQSFQRDWSWFGPESPCDSWVPVALIASADDAAAVLVGAHNDGAENGLAVVRLDEKGQLVRREKWSLGPAGGEPLPLHAAGNPSGLLMIAGLESGVGFNSGFVSLWTSDGQRCADGISSPFSPPSTLTEIKSGNGPPTWLIATSQIGAGQAGMTLQWYRAPAQCGNLVFSDRFEMSLLE